MAATQTLQMYSGDPTAPRGPVVLDVDDYPTAPTTVNTLATSESTDARGGVMAGHIPSENSIAEKHRKPVLSTIPSAGVPSEDLSDTDDVRPRPVDA